MKKPLPVFLGLSTLLASTLSLSCRDAATGVPPITPGEIEAHIRFLSDDLLEGREVGKPGIEIAALYQESCFRAYGLDPFFGEGYRQPFELRGSSPDPNARVDVLNAGEDRSFALWDDFVVTTYRPDAPETVQAELVYAGYLIQAPERDWDDIKGADLRGKALLVLINEPGNAPGGIFDGEDMNYYGRWKYKFDKAAELGAAGVMIIHDTKGAAYGWDVVKNGWSQESFQLTDTKQELVFQGWFQGAAAGEIFSMAGLSLSEMRAAAEEPSFEPRSLGVTLRVRQKPVFRSVTTDNVAGILRGRHPEHQDRTVVLSAHYDHLGRDPELEGDQIYNGAVDNCSASASLLALARYYAANPQELKVNLVFAGLSAEEQVMLGSEYLVRHLSLPNTSVLANLNFEMTNVWGETKDVYAIGGEHSDLGEICRKAAERIGLTYIPERDKELGYFFRSDQLSFARGGIPAVWLHEGIRSRGADEGRILARQKEYRARGYHKVDDEIGDDWDLEGTVQICTWAREIIALLEATEQPPNFSRQSSFRRPAPTL